jgi:hypothetical protein
MSKKHSTAENNNIWRLTLSKYVSESALKQIPSSNPEIARKTPHPMPFQAPPKSEN